MIELKILERTFKFTVSKKKYDIQSESVKEYAKAIEKGRKKAELFFSNSKA